MLVLACGGDSAPPTLDAGPCTSDEECNDGRICNGAESCAMGSCVSSAPLDCDDGIACTLDRCVERLGGCVNDEPDLDGDGATDSACGGNDCDDSDANRFGGNVEVCDVSNVDEDCDPTTIGDRDADGDGAIAARCCNGDNCGDDCDDAQPHAHPGEAEDCDTIDNDCDGSIDEGVLATFYADADGDGFGATGGTTIEACFATAGHAERDGDCDDEDELANPGLPEVCDSSDRDDDCDGVINAGCDCTGSEARACLDGEGLELQGACAAGVERCVEGSFSVCTVRPINEVCDGVTDEDCDGSVDEELTIPCWPDFDNDGFAAVEATPIDVWPTSGSCPGGTTDRDPLEVADCDDRLGSRRPTAPERIDNGVDDDCDGNVDES